MRLIRLPEVMSRTGLGRSYLYAEINGGRFPRPVKISDRAVAWVDDEVDGWVTARMAARDAAHVSTS